ncbi:MAG: hypothetical protein CL569_17410 [Alphaproteobacteria bacterium]|nr:hypothetical protein [Alphaproteobacteria bacterium]|tara:strand:+ start:360 stop:833 length:474 start_codon:yes stop_codon:yes gene_type:complete
MSDRHRIIDVTLDEQSFVRRNPDVEHERRVAIFDLLQENRFALVDGVAGPFRVHVSVRESRLVFEVRSEDEQDIDNIVLALTPFRRIIREYFLICESYYDAIKSATPSRIEAIDMGRRGLHDEGAQLLRRHLASKVEVDDATSRRLFTLICVLHFRG